VPLAPTADGCTSAVEGRTGAGGTAALGAAARRHGVGASEVKGRPVVREIGFCESIADAASGGGNSTGSSAGPATTRSIQGRRQASLWSSAQNGAKGCRQSPLNDGLSLRDSKKKGRRLPSSRHGVVTPHLTTVQKGAVSPHLTTAWHYGIRRKRGGGSPRHGTGSSLPT
jgi:hypothetical protein